MQKTNYKYYLGNGSCLEYDLSPGCDLVKVIDYLASDYVAARTGHLPDKVYLRPDILSALNKLFWSRSRIMLANNGPTAGFQVSRLQCIIGSLQLIPKVGLEFPIFIGTDQEYKDNCFSLLMEDILNEQGAARG